MTLCLGLMSGTSMDGVDAALLETDGETHLVSRGGSFFPYPRIFQILLKVAEWAARLAQGDPLAAESLFSKSWRAYTTRLQIHDAELTALEQEACHYLNEQLSLKLAKPTFSAVIQCSTHLHRQACERLLHQQGLNTSDIDLIGYHGQTLYHNPPQGISWQAGDGQALANALRVNVIGHFRQQDIDHGGQGAPLTPLYHYALVNHETLYPAAIINCGGIANVSVVLSGAIGDLNAFDAGPGNVLLDRLISQATGGLKRYDHDGELALRGTVSCDGLALLHAHALPAGFLNQLPPKSLDSHDCHLPEGFEQLALEDALATLAAFTADCLVKSLLNAFSNTRHLKHVILAGGGWYNAVILREFKHRLSAHMNAKIQISSASQLGWQQDLLEAEAFAYLAKRSLLGLTLSLPLTTGIHSAKTGGTCFYPQ